jgi:hypothetical protein
LDVIVKEDFGNVPTVDVRPFGLSNWAFDSYLIYFSVVVSVVSLCVKVGVGTSGNYENCVMGGEGIGLL